MKKIITSIGIAALTLFAACTNDLNVSPKIELTLEEILANDPNAVEGLVSKLYASYALTGPSGPDSSDINSPDAGEGAFLRAIINLQDFTADAMKNRWGDDGLDQLTTTSNWDSNNKFFRLFYDRAFYTIPQCNNFLQTLKVIDVPNEENIQAEVRFLRALAYYNIIDVFGKGVLATEENFGQSQLLPEASRMELFNYVESELLAIEPVISTTSSYGRANKYVVDMLLAKLYINAEVYTGTAHWDEAAIYVNKIITEGGYTLESNFIKNFSADNDTSSEIIFPLIAEPLTSQSYGNTTYIVNGSLNANTMPINQFGATGGWEGHRATKAWYGLYGDLATSTDIRASLFWTQDQNYEMTDYKEWEDGYPSVKYRNTNTDGSGLPTEFSGTDFPFYRLADVYLMYTELAIRGASGTNTADALTYLNNVRVRSGATAATSADLTLDYIIDERGRELNLEGHRRSDLIRFNKFTGNAFLWPWKGNSPGGTSIPEHYKLFPIPSTALQANTNLKQNPGY